MIFQFNILSVWANAGNVPEKMPIIAEIMQIQQELCMQQEIQGPSNEQLAVVMRDIVLQVKG